MTQIALVTEQKIRACFDAGNLEEAASCTIRAYGREILSFLAARLRDQGDAQEAFSMFAEDLWNGLAKFGWRCSMRTWTYVLARNAATRLASSPHRGHGRHVRLSCPNVLSQLVEHVRTSTELSQRTDMKDKIRSLREQLDPEDQMLLVLRVDRELAWRDLAIAMRGDADLSEDEIERESVRLRKAFERLKGQLKRLAEREGLLKPKD